MTAQISEVLIYQNEKLAMCTEPLEYYFDKHGGRPDFEPPHTACERGYRGIWEICDNKLFLIDLGNADLHFAHGGPKLWDGTKVTLSSLFPNSGEKVFADWYTGQLRCPQGKRVIYVHFGHESKYERDFLIRIENGIVISEQTRENFDAEDIRKIKEETDHWQYSLDCPAFLRKTNEE